VAHRAGFSACQRRKGKIEWVGDRRDRGQRRFRRGMGPGVGEEGVFVRERKAIPVRRGNPRYN